jgi:hypothetical protein
VSSAPNKNSDFDLTDVTNDHWKKRVECHWVVCHAHSEVFSHVKSTDIGMIRKIEVMCHCTGHLFDEFLLASGGRSHITKQAY